MLRRIGHRRCDLRRMPTPVAPPAGPQSFHPSSFANQKKKWIHEERYRQKLRKEKELHREHAQEQALFEAKCGAMRPAVDGVKLLWLTEPTLGACDGLRRLHCLACVAHRCWRWTHTRLLVHLAGDLP